MVLRRGGPPSNWTHSLPSRRKEILTHFRDIGHAIVYIPFWGRPAEAEPGSLGSFGSTLASPERSSTTLHPKAFPQFQVRRRIPKEQTV